MKISFFSESNSFKLKHKLILKKWILLIFAEYFVTPKQINYIFCDDEYLLQLNKKYLNHDTLTDIITFDNTVIKGFVESDIFISVERVAENAKKFDKTFDNELQRVMIHGVLHLCGFHDKTKSSAIIMRYAEDDALALLQKLMSQ